MIAGAMTAIIVLSLAPEHRIGTPHTAQAFACETIETQTLNVSGMNFRERWLSVHKTLSALASDKLLSRRTLSAGLSSAIGVLVAQVTLESHHAKAGTTFRKGVGEAALFDIPFKKFQQSDLDSEDQVALNIVKEFIVKYKALVLPKDGPGQGDQLVAPNLAAYSSFKSLYALKLLAVIPQKLDAAFKNANKRPFSQDSYEHDNQILFEALPRYLASKGIFFWADQIPLRSSNNPTAVTWVDIFSLHEVKDVIPVNPNPVLRGKPFQAEEIQVTGPLTYQNELCTIMNDAAPGRSAYDRTVAYLPMIQRRVDEIGRWQTVLAGLRSEILPYKKYGWTEFRDQPTRRVNALQFSIRKLEASLVEYPMMADALLAWMTGLVRWQSIERLYRFRNGLYEKGELPLTVLGVNDFYRRVNMIPAMAGLITSLLETSKDDWPMTLHHLLAPLDAPLVAAIIPNFAVTALMTEELIANYNDYGITIEKSDTAQPGKLSEREQALGQLWSLTPANAKKLMAKVQAYFDQNADTVYLNPRPTVKDLLEGYILKPRLVPIPQTPAGFGKKSPAVLLLNPGTRRDLFRALGTSA